MTLPMKFEFAPPTSSGVMKSPRVSENVKIEPATTPGTARPEAHCVRVSGSRESVSVRLYICAVISRKKMLAQALPVSSSMVIIAAAVKRPRATIRTSAPRAPMAPASVGVNRPP